MIQICDCLTQELRGSIRVQQYWENAVSLKSRAAGSSAFIRRMTGGGWREGVLCADTFLSPFTVSRLGCYCGEGPL